MPIEKIPRIPVTRQNLTPYRRPSYYKLECPECESIIGVKWEKTYYGSFPRPYSAPHAQSCPVCEHNGLKWFKIRAEDYEEINKTWDLAELSAEKQENLDDWHSWLV